jgi:phosphoribosyl 1,2-cyclic phosphate phosphodiesterase
MTGTVIILGCGSSGGVPRIGNHWGACDPENPKNRRRRCSILVQRKGPDGTTNVLVDTSPDMRNQLLDANVNWLDGVLYTHEHADHIHGIDDLRMVAINGRSRVSVYMSELTAALVTRRFHYCFETPVESPYPPILDLEHISAAQEVTINGAGGAITSLPFTQIHGHIQSLGFRFGNIAYSSDLNDLPSDSISALQGLDVWIVDALRYSTHPSHFSLEETLEWIERLKPKRAILTNMHIDLDYETLRRTLPAHVEPAYDGLRIEMDTY